MIKLNTKNLLAIASVVIILVVIGFLLTKNTNLFKNEKETKTEVLGLTKIEDKQFVGKYIGTESVDNKKIFGTEASTGQTAKTAKNEKKIADDIGPYMVSMCRNFTKIYDLVRSPTFKMVKEKVDKIKNSLENKDNFLYVTLPEVVSINCINSDKGFTDGLIRYLQSDYTDVLVADAANIKKFVEYIDNIKFASTEDISATRIQNDKEYFKEILFDKSLAGLEDVYFSEYTFLKDQSDEDFFKHFSILSLEERNEILERTVGKLTVFLKKIGIKDVEQLRKMILKNYGYGTSVEGVKSNLIKKYQAFDKKLKGKGINLTLELMDISSLSKFYTGEKFKLIQADPELYALFKDIGLGHLHYSIISDKFADSLNEGWSGKEQFGDSIIGNGIIRIGFLYLRETGKNLQINK